MKSTLTLTLASRCQHNVESWLREIGFPPELAPILQSPPSLSPQPDQCFLPWSQPLESAIASHCVRWDKAIRWQDHQPLSYPTARRGYRECRARWAAQPIVHNDALTHLDFIGVDFDANNPAWGLGPALLHGLLDWTLQKIRKRRTDPFTVARKRGWAE